MEALHSLADLLQIPEFKAHVATLVNPTTLSLTVVFVSLISKVARNRTLGSTP